MNAVAAGAKHGRVKSWSAQSRPASLASECCSIRFQRLLHRLQFLVDLGSHGCERAPLARLDDLAQLEHRRRAQDHGPARVPIRTTTTSRSTPISRGRDRTALARRGSFWSGIKLFPLDPEDRQASRGETRKYSLASPPGATRGARSDRGAIPDPSETAIYYLFVSFDYCCRGVAAPTTLWWAVRRDVIGPYAGRDGQPMTRRLRHAAVARRPPLSRSRSQRRSADADGDYLVYHAYDAQHGGRPTLRISSYHMDRRRLADGERVTLPRSGLRGIRGRARHNNQPLQREIVLSSRSSMSVRPSALRKSSTMFR